ncbi:hypothetical protein CL6EHI_127680 [Entamoeba histolytica]|uniref:Uncharacterized protein n=4 Tax=Entamoeba histolytica TaxID=5759 RepID=B1N4W9_ENTH1|nr:hypothetical protein EHI_127680 [Entamoeba histolytica HM-1:IMSS]EDS88988.1 hypothetical protein EHI_127680 [Entamoeba histolytica HM-1:IMSS]EMD43797.1 serine/threonine kinase, putative [Entamoeba histolytica KU27]ENY63828.1 protein serine/threonine kinase, putative [Entamoeba histolytica HM-1:IMSS-A]GAT98972.1 hypothetical protein CL6EHI_127680 [Entamoeba histolytica]|eukprot:XP_001914235.1 hypothetical protein EHI_127680 [Entamoeba histolytica HM-1:IMSS]
MVCYYIYNDIEIDDVTSTFSKTFTPNDEDDFNSFVVTVTVSLLSDYWIRYESKNQITFSIIGKKQLSRRIQLKLTIGTSDSGTTIIKEETTNTLSSVIITTSKHLSSISKQSFTRSTTYQSQITIKGTKEIIFDDFGYSNCDKLVYKEDLTQCNHYKEEYKLTSNNQCIKHSQLTIKLEMETLVPNVILLNSII